MSNESLVNEVIGRLKDEGFLMISDDFIDRLITTLHANVTGINTMVQIAEIENKMLVISGSLPIGSRQVESLKELSTRIAEIAFTIEDVRNDQR